MNTRARRIAFLLASCVALASVVALEKRRPYTVASAPDIGLAQPSENASWPWPDASKTTPHHGVTSWKATSRDGTLCELLEFNLDANPKLRL